MRENQKEKILKALQEKNGEWINGRYFNDTFHITQFHTRIHELQKLGYGIEASNFKDEYGFKSYRLMSEGLTGLPATPIKTRGESENMRWIREEMEKRKEALRKPALINTLL